MSSVEELRALMAQIDTEGASKAERALRDARWHIRDAANAAERSPDWYDRQARAAYSGRAFRSLDAAEAAGDEFAAMRVAEIRRRLTEIVGFQLAPSGEGDDHIANRQEVDASVAQTFAARATIG